MSIINLVLECCTPLTRGGVEVGVEKFSTYPYHLKFAKVNYHIKFKKKLLEVFAIINKIYWNNIWIRKWMKEWLIRRWKRMSCSERAMKTGPWNWNCVQWSSSLAKRKKTPKSKPTFQPFYIINLINFIKLGHFQFSILKLSYIRLFKLLITINIEWKTKILKIERDT